VQILARGAARLEAVTASYHKPLLDADGVGDRDVSDAAPAAAASPAAAGTPAGSSPAPSVSEVAGAAVGSETRARPAPSPSPSPTPSPSPAPAKPPPLGPSLPEKKKPSYKPKKVGTLYQEKKWGEYEAKAGPSALKRKSSLNGSRLLKISALSRVERIQAVVPLSRWPRLIVTFALTLMLCMIKEGDRLASGESSGSDINSSNSGRLFVENEKRMLDSCSGLLSGAHVLTASSPSRGLSAIPSMARACLDSSRVVASMALSAQFPWAAAIERPLVYIGLASLVTVLVLFLTSYVFPGILARHVDASNQNGNDAGTMMKKMMSMLPPNILTAFHGISLLRTLVNTVFMDASCYIVIMVTYHLILVYSSL
jgi:hypothetical protein